MYRNEDMYGGQLDEDDFRGGHWDEDDFRGGAWDEDMYGGKPCSEKSKYVNNDNYACNTKTGRYGLKKGLKRKNAIKRPLNGYMLWLKEARPSIKKVLSKKYGDKVPPKEVLRAAGTIWKNLKGKPVRAKFEKAAGVLKAQYAEKVKAHTGPTYTIQKKERKTGPRKISAWQNFLVSFKARSENKNRKFARGELFQKASDEWKTYSQEDKDLYNS